MDLEVLWSRLDKERCGYLSREELFKGLTETKGIQVRLNPSAIINLVKEADFEESGYVGKSAFIDVFLNVEVVDKKAAWRKRLTPRWFCLWYLVVALFLASLTTLFGLLFVHSRMTEDLEKKAEILFWRDRFIVITASIFVIAVGWPLIEFWYSNRSKWETWRDRIDRTEDLERGAAVERLARRGKWISEGSYQGGASAPPQVFVDPPPPPEDLPPALEDSITPRVTFNMTKEASFRSVAESDDGTASAPAFGGFLHREPLRGTASLSIGGFANQDSVCRSPSSSRPTSAASHAMRPCRSASPRPTGDTSGAAPMGRSASSRPACPERSSKRPKTWHSEASSIGRNCERMGRPQMRRMRSMPVQARHSPPPSCAPSLPAPRDIGRKPVEIPHGLVTEGFSRSGSMATASTAVSSGTNSRPGSARGHLEKHPSFEDSEPATSRTRTLPVPQTRKAGPPDGALPPVRPAGVPRPANITRTPSKPDMEPPELPGTYGVSMPNTPMSQGPRTEARGRECDTPYELH